MYQINLEKYNTFTTKSPSSLKLLQKKNRNVNVKQNFLMVDFLVHLTGFFCSTTF